MKGATTDLKFLMAEMGVEEDVQAAIYHFGFNSVGLFATLAGDMVSFRQALVDEFGMTTAGDLQMRAKVARLVQCWEQAREQKSKEIAAKADNKAGNIPQLAPTQEVRGMIVAYEKRFLAPGKKLPRMETPSRGFIGKKLKETEENEPIAELLSEVTGLEDGEENYLNAEVGVDGKIRV